MRFTKIRLTGLIAVELPVIGALPSDKYILKAADGLGPPEVDVSIIDTLNAGGVYQGRRPQNREIVLRVGLNPDYSTNQTAADLRSSLYGMLTPGSSESILVEIVNDNTTIAQTTGYVKRLEISPFSKDAEVQITIACTSPYLQDPHVLFVDPGNPASPTILNSGTAPSGFHMEAIFTADVENWVLTGPNGQSIEFDYPFIANDTLIFDTRAGFRSIQLKRLLATTNLLSALSANSFWLELIGGENVFSVSSDAFTWGDVFYTPQYWGI